MKRTMLLALCLFFLMGSAFARQMLPAAGPIPQEIPVIGKLAEQTRSVPNFTFSRNPTALLNSYYDYMIGSYNGLPLQVIPDTAGGGYFLTFHGRRQPSATRRVFYAYLDASGNVINVNEISMNYTPEGYSTVGVDPVGGKPLYAWHANGDADQELEVQFTSDAFLFGLAGLFNDVVTVINNPTVISGSFMGNAYNSTNNEFIWPTLQIGPSPNPSMRRVYVLARNSVAHNTNGSPSENPYIAYADFNADIIESGTPLSWSYTSIPEMNWWNHQPEWRRPFHAMTVDHLGNLYYAGYHFATQSDGTTNINEPDLDVFKCTNYGQGSWTRVSTYSNLPSWNPPDQPGGNIGFFVSNDTGLPYTNAQLFWTIGNSSHLNAVCDSQGRVHVIGIWSLKNSDGFYYPNFQTVKSFIYDPSDQSFAINEIYPQKNPNDNFNQYYQPWDLEAPFGQADSYTYDGYDYYLDFETNLPFPHWNSNLHESAMYFHYNNLKISEPNSQGMMVAVWQDSQKASYGVQYPEVYPEMVPYATGSEIMISVSSDNGSSWSEPIRLNAVDTPQMAGIKPMWVYPANKVIYTGLSQNGNPMGKIGIMFYNDYTWGANAINPPAHPTNDGGQVMFTELHIEFAPGNPIPNDPFGEPIVLSGSMTLMAGVLIDNQNAAAGDVVAAYVNVNGTPQLRGKETVQIINGVPGCLILIYTESNGESIYFKVWDASTNQVLTVSETLPSEVNATVGSWPNNLFWLHAGAAPQQNLNLQTGWNMVSLNLHPQNMAISSVFSPIMQYIHTIKSPDGVFQPGNPYNTLTQLQDGKGYSIRVSSACSVSINGAPVTPGTPIPLQGGWNLVGYTLPTALPVVNAISSISPFLIQIKGSEGVYEPANPYNTLTSLSPGRAYWMKLTGTANLVYPSGTRHLADVQEIAADGPILKSNSQTVLLGFGDFAKAGDVISAWVEDELRGQTEVKVVDSTAGALLQIFCEDPEEHVVFKLTDRNGKKTINLEPGLITEPGSIVGNYNTNQYYMLFTDSSEAPEFVTGLGRAYPNPFKQGTHISLSIAKDATELEVGIYNIKGQKVRSLVNGALNAGTMNLWWDGMDANGRQMPSGVYFCRLQNGNTNQNIKLMLVK